MPLAHISYNLRPFHLPPHPTLSPASPRRAPLHPNPPRLVGPAQPRRAVLALPRPASPRPWDVWFLV